MSLALGSTCHTAGLRLVGLDDTRCVGGIGKSVTLSSRLTASSFFSLLASH